MKPYNDEDMGDNYGVPSYERLQEDLNSKYNEVEELRKQVAKLLNDRVNTERKPCINNYCISCKYLKRSEVNETFFCSYITADTYEARIREDCDGYPLQLEIYNPAQYGCVLYSER